MTLKKKPESQTLKKWILFVFLSFISIFSRMIMAHLTTFFSNLLTQENFSDSCTIFLLPRKEREMPLCFDIFYIFLTSWSTEKELIIYLKIIFRSLFLNSKHVQILSNGPSSTYWRDLIQYGVELNLLNTLFCTQFKWS